VVLIIGAVASSFSWLLVMFEEPSAFNRIVYPLMMVICAALAVVLWWRGERALWFVGLVGYTGPSFFLLTKAWHALYLDYESSGALAELPEISSWASVLIFAAFLVFGFRVGLVASLLFYVSLLGFTLLHAALKLLLAGEGVYTVRALAQLYLSNTVITVLLFRLTRLAENYVETRVFSEAMKRLANADFLTGIANRRRLYELLRNEGEEAIHYHRPLSVVVFDLDGFKKINDGKATISGIVCSGGSFLGRSSPPQGGSVEQMGGEKFLVLAPETNLQQAKPSAIRLKQVIEDRRFGEVGKVTASFGVTTYRDRATP
jgi:diguanylate cyclase